jgi:hypothetical protein
MDGPSIDQELEALFNWNPPPFLLAADASKSKHSRTPSFYNKHLRDNLILKEVMLLPSLHQDIAGVVDLTLSEIRNKGIQLPAKDPDDLFCTQKSRARLDYYANQPVKDEASVATFYSKTTVKYCAPVASTLALHPSAPEWLRALEWHTVPSKSGYAIANGVLRILPSLKPFLLGERDATGFEQVLLGYIRQNFDDDRWKGLVEVMKRLPDVMTMVIKSLSVSPDDTMHLLKDLSGSKFLWVTCAGCGSHKIASGASDALIDATVTPWSIPAPLEISSEDRDNHRDNHNDNIDDGNDNDDDYIIETHASLTAQKFVQQVIDCLSFL